MLSVIIVNFNSKYYTEACIELVLSQNRTDYEIILIDNASSDNNAEFVRRRFSEVNVVENKSNRGFSGGVNNDIRISKGDYILTLNNDTIMEKGSITEMKKVMEHDPAIGMCASKMVFPDG
ncbi:MAG TPA: glycosyltransferase family 2 protein, partial [Methanoregulaceae archaeon]|nr:glycosyltransferase family 2 protein [Methanoregulaceae archaeon]